MFLKPCLNELEDEDIIVAEEARETGRFAPSPFRPRSFRPNSKSFRPNPKSFRPNLKSFRPNFKVV